MSILTNRNFWLCLCGLIELIWGNYSDHNLLKSAGMLAIMVGLIDQCM